MAPAPGLWPREEMRPASSHAERAVFKALRTGLPPGWTAWHSLRLRDGAAWLGEGDFVLAHPDRGILVLEVKGGHISQRDGQWYTNEERLKRPPLDQALNFVTLLKRRLAQQGHQAPAAGAAVCFPDTEFERPPGEDILAGIVLGAHHLPWLREALPPVIDRALPHRGDACGAWIDCIHAMWGETWVPALSLGARVKKLGGDRFALTDAQLETLDGLLDNDRVLVKGGAGSGKTLLAAEAARREAAGGKRVLLLCFTQPLHRWLADRLSESGVEVSTASGLAKSIVEAAEGPSRPQSPTDSEYWESLLLRSCDLAKGRWEAVVVDEAQDLQEAAWFLVAQLAPKGKRLWAFYDPGQSFWADRKPPAELFTTQYRLPKGLRSPPGIQALANRYIGEPSHEPAIRAALADGTLGVVECPSASSVPDKIGAEVDRLLSSGLEPGDVAIVSLRGQTAPDAIFTHERVGRHALVRADAPDMTERLVADSFLRWKGLERPAVIVADLPDGELAQLKIRNHVALTRALVAARIVAPRSTIARDPVLAAVLRT